MVTTPFQVDPRAVGQQVACCQQSTQILCQIVREWRVQKYQVKLLPVPALQETDGVTFEHGRSFGLEDTCVFAQCGGGSRRAFDESSGRCTARQRFESQGAAARKQIKTMTALDGWRQPVENRLPDSFGGWPQSRHVRDRQKATSPFSRYNTQPSGPVTGFAAA